MRIHLDQIEENGLSLAYSEPAETFPVLAELIQNEECEFTKPVDINLQVNRVSDMVNVTGDLKTTVRLACDRCLGEFNAELESDFSLTYSRDFEEAPEEDGDELELSPEEMGMMPIRGEEIDFREGVQEQVILAFPLQALCSNDCKGLCPQCGTDLNKAECTCSKVVPAGKFAALRKLKFKDS